MSKYIKFSCERVVAEITSFGGLAELNAYRRKLLDLHLIGVDPNGIGVGNLSVRDGATNSFYITGSATGGIHELTLADCAKVVACDFETNCIRYEGSTIALIGIAGARCNLQVGCNHRSGYALSLLQVVGSSFE